MAQVFCTASYTHDGRYSDLCATLGIKLHQYARETYTRQLAIEQVSGPELDKSSRGIGGEAMFLT